MKARILAVSLAVLMATPAFCGAAKGSSYSKAISLKATQTVKLVPEWDTDEKEPMDNGVAYYKVTLSRGQAYTIWIDGGNAADLDLDVFTDDEYYEDRENEPSAGFDVDELDGGATKVAYLYADDWDLDPEDGDPKSGRYIVEIDGEIGAGTTLHYTKGIKNFTKVGSEESPKVLSFANSWKTFSGKMIDGEYYARTTLKAGRRYRVYMTGGKKDAELGLDVGTSGDDDEDILVQDDVQYSNAYNDALIVTPGVTGKYMISLSGDTSQSFKIHYRALPTRAIGSHVAVPLIPENNYESKFVPGRISDNLSYYDEIIDEHLCKIYLNKGERWAFETSGATNGIQMVAYDSKGKVLATNESIDGEDFDTRVVITASAAGVYYVGVCDPQLDVGDTPSGAQVTLSARNTTDMTPPDAFDPADDVYTGATVLWPCPAGSNQVVDATAPAFVNGPHRFGANDLYDCYAIDCRKGYTYSLRAQFEDAATSNRFALAHKVFYIASGKEKTVSSATGTLTPFGVSADGDLTFKATVNGRHYIRVWVSDGKGLDYPAYMMTAWVTNGDKLLGLVKTEALGAAGTFSLNAETEKYPSGAVLALGTNANLKVVFNNPTGFKAVPASTNVVVPAWTDGAEPVTVTAKYYDLYDFKYQTGTKTVTKNGKKTTTKLYSPADGDATPAGAFAITPAYKAATVKRTLWADDPADIFSFTAATNVYYNFSLADTTPNGAGDATFVISNATSGVVCEDTEITKALLPAGKTYVIVTHTNAEPSDSTYNLTYSRASGGVVKFKFPAKSTAFSVKEGSEYATLTVSRTGSEGEVKVRYFTEAATALPGTNYYPVTDGVVSWKNGDKADKAIKIKLIPDLKAQWAASNLYFNVKLEPVDEYGLATDEYLARLGASMAKVTITEASSKTPGTIALTEYRCGGDRLPIANAKKPALNAVAQNLDEDGGTPVELTFSRTGGTSGKVSVKLAYVLNKADTAKSKTDFEVPTYTLTWEDGDAEPQTVTFWVYRRSETDFTASRKFTLTMSVVKTGFTPTLAAKTATVTILNDIAKETAAAYAKTLPSGVKLTTTGTWFRDEDGVYRSGTANGVTTFTLTGPGLFVCQPTVVLDDEASARLTCQFNKEAAVDLTGERIVRALAAGTTTVKIALADVTGMAYATFEPQADGEPYAFTPFKSTVPAEPVNKAVVTTNLTALSWTVPAALAGESRLYVRVRFGTSTKALTAIAWGEAGTLTEVALPSVLAAGKTYYWAVDYALADADGLDEEAVKALKWIAAPATWQFSTIKDGAPLTVVSAGTDAAGKAIADLVADGEPVELIQCVNTASLGMTLDGNGEGEKALEANKYRLVAGSLPKGVTINAATGGLKGCPTTVGEWTVLLQSYNDTEKTTTKTVNGKKKKTTTHTYTYGTTIPVTFKVIPAGTALGSWCGSVTEDGGAFENDSRQLGLITLSATSAGKLTAKVTIAGVAYTFTGTTGYTEMLSREEDSAAGDFRRFRAELKNTTTIAKKKYTNLMTLEVDDGATTNALALAQVTAKVELMMQVSNAKKTGVTKDVAYTGTLYRNNGGTALGKDAIADYVGYYTVGLAPEGVSAADGVPMGHGYLTLTVAAANTVKVAGVLADGTSVSLSTFGQLVGNDLSDPKACALMIPVTVAKGTYALAGCVRIGYETAEAELPVAVPSEKLLWVKNKAAATSRDGSGFALDLAPTGGWYDKVENLQAHYLGRDFALQAADDAGDLPAEALASGYAFSTSAAVQSFLATPEAMAARFVGNAFKVDARKLVKNKTTSLYDFDESVNPWNVTVKFTRATGIITGTFSAWEWMFKSDDVQDFATKQKEIKKLTHKGVWLYSRDASGESPLRADAVSAGFFLMPATKSWKASLPFCVLETTEDPEPVWDEVKDLEEDVTP